MQEPRPAMSGEQMRQYLAEVGAHLAARGLTGEMAEIAETRDARPVPERIAGG